MDASSPAEARFSVLVDCLASVPGVERPDTSPGRRFGAQALRVGGSIFAMVSGGRLVVKLPRSRVEALVAEGTGAPFDAGKGRPMKEWVAVTVQDDEVWTALAQEALAFVRSGR